MVAPFKDDEDQCDSLHKFWLAGKVWVYLRCGRPPHQTGQHKHRFKKWSDQYESGYIARDDDDG